MTNEIRRSADRLLRPWTTKGLLIYDLKAQYVEVEVPFLALDTRAVARAVTSDFESAIQARWDKRVFATGITVEELSYYNQKLNDERTGAERGFTMAAAILAHRGYAFPPVVSRTCLGQYLHRHFLRGGRGVVEASPVDFLFLADDSTPTIFVTEILCDVTRFVGQEFLSIKVSEEELEQKIREAITRLEAGTPGTDCSLSEIVDWYNKERMDAHDEN